MHGTARAFRNSLCRAMPSNTQVPLGSSREDYQRVARFTRISTRPNLAMVASTQAWHCFASRASSCNSREPCRPVGGRKRTWHGHLKRQRLDAELLHLVSNRVYRAGKCRLWRDGLCSDHYVAAEFG